MPLSKGRPDLGSFAGIQSRLASIRALTLELSESQVSDEDRHDMLHAVKYLSDVVSVVTPTERCPFCGGRGDGCTFCAGLGWVSKARLAMVPAEVLEMQQKLEAADASGS